MITKTDILVVGAGASGLAAAVSAGSMGAAVLVLEKKEQSGKKLLLTGNGRCNLTNRRIGTEDYYTHEPAFIERFLGKFQTEDALSFFRELGLFTTDRGDYVYPMSMQSASVRQALSDRLQDLQIPVLTGQNVRAAEYDLKKQLFLVHCEDADYQAQRLILSCGTAAGVRDKNPYLGEKLLRSFSHHVYPMKPALVSLLGNAGIEHLWDGVRHTAAVSFGAYRETGEIQFRKDGLSGIPVLQISHPVSEALDRDGSAVLHLDFIPEFSGKELEDVLLTRQKALYGAERNIYDILSGFMPKKLIRPVLALAEEDGSRALSTLSESDIRRLSEKLKSCPYPVQKTGTAESAQVMRGGADLKEISGDMESLLQKGLYITGELLDLDGRCGGYNLHFAWGSGIFAGKAAANSLLSKFE